MPDERYALLVNLGKKITDYSVDRSLLNDGECLCYAQSIYDLFVLQLVWWNWNLQYYKV